MQTATVVIPNLNGMRFLKDCLDSLMEQSRQDFSIVLIDNGSADGSAEYVESHYPEVQVCRNQKNLGFLQGGQSGDPPGADPLRDSAEQRYGLRPLLRGEADSGP